MRWRRLTFMIASTSGPREALPLIWSNAKIRRGVAEARA
jgi:hypothetical protein